jgi:nucleoid-associated protein YgaU
MGLFNKRSGSSALAEPSSQTRDDLKQKYQPVLNTMQQQNVRLTNVHMDNGKLLIRGEAPSEEAKNRVWEQIKLVNPRWSSELVADITVRPGAASYAPGVGGAGVTRTYVVKPGDTLSKLAQQFYGDASQYRRIFEANRDKVTDPDRIQVGQVLTIPA